MNRKIKLFGFTCILLVVASSTSKAKCPTPSVIITGNIDSGVPNPTVLVRVYGTRGKSFTERPVKINGTKFDIRIPFSTLVSTGPFGSHDCSRLPAKVEVTLLKGEIRTKTLEFLIERDFEWNEKKGEWRIKAAIVFSEKDAAKVTCPLLSFT